MTEEYGARPSACGGCSRRLQPLPPTHRNHLCEYLCPRCGTVGFRRRDGYYVWSLGGDDSAESRQARANYRVDGYGQMRTSGVRPLPGLGD